MRVGIYMRVATEEQLMEKALEELKKDPRTYTLSEVEEELSEEWNRRRKTSGCRKGALYGTKGDI